MPDARLIPHIFATDPRFAALSHLALDALESDPAPCLIMLIDMAPAAVLPELAEQFGVARLSGYEFLTNDDDRRAFLKSAMDLLRHRGTKWAVLRVLSLFGLEANLDEWFETAPIGDVNFPSQPFTFRIVLANGADGTIARFNDAFVATLRRYIDFWKRQSAHYSLAVKATSTPQSMVIAPIATPFMLCVATGNVITQRS